MPKYFVDYRHNGDIFLDDEGSVLSGIDVARKEALGLLSEFVKFVLPESGSSEITATVRDERDTELYRATLIYHAERLD